MPGIFGLWTREKQSPLPEKLDSMAMSMRHQPGLLVEVNSYPGLYAGRVHLGYLQPEAQPTTDSSNRYALWMDGEFNNAPELRSLYDLGHLAEEGDAELALALFMQTGFSFLPEVDGLFALAIYDQLTHDLTLISDRYGLRPLYWVETATGFAYGGEVKALLEVADVSANIDPLAVKEWFSFGLLLGNRTWIDGIEMLPTGTIMQVTTRGISQKQYWSWNEIQELPQNADEDEIVEEMARLWHQAVERRIDDNRVGQFLSGGLDSRAILAAVPTTKHPYQTLTFGLKNCLDERIARRVSELAGVEHQFVEIDDRNWLLPRFDAVWRTDGMCRVLDLHGAESIPEFKQFCDVHLHGYLGDATAGGSYLGAMDPLTFLNKKMLLKHGSGLEMTNPLGYLERIYSRAPLRPDRFLVDQRGRRFINFGSISASAYLEWRYPFFDKDYIMFVFAIPDSLRSDSYIYQQMLLHEFPEYYRDIPWQKTGSPIGSPPWRKRFQGTTLLAKKAITHGGQKLGISWLNLRDSYVNYHLWLRSEPSRSLVAKLLMSNDALYADHLNREIARNIVVDFMDNNDDFHLVTLGLLLTFEIYLRQLAGSEGYRGNGPG